MKRFNLILCILCFSLLLGACGAVGTNTSYRNVEQLLVIETLGLDYISGGVKVSLASSTANEQGGPVRLSNTGDSISTAIERIETHSTDKELFSAHITQVLIGDKAAREGVEPYLSYICRSPDMRLDVPVFIVRDGSAEELILYTGDDKAGISELIKGVQNNLDERNDGSIIPAANILRNVERWGGSLVSALEYTRSAEQSGKETLYTAAISGYAVLKGWNLCSFINREDAIGVDFILNQVGVSDIVVRDKTRQATMEIHDGNTSIHPEWDEKGCLEGLEVRTKLTASVLEANGGEDAISGEDSEKLKALLEKELAGRISHALLLSRNLGVDFMGLSSKVEQTSPYKYRNMSERFSQILPDLKFSVSVTVQLNHTNDIKDA